MFENVRDKFRQNVRNLDYVMTLHAEEEMENDGLSIFDVEAAILTGDVIERQKDHDTSEWKYIVSGRSLDDETINVVGKLSPRGKLVIITVYSEGNGRTS